MGNIFMVNEILFPKEENQVIKEGLPFKTRREELNHNNQYKSNSLLLINRIQWLNSPRQLLFSTFAVRGIEELLKGKGSVVGMS